LDTLLGFNIRPCLAAHVKYGTPKTCMSHSRNAHGNAGRTATQGHHARRKWGVWCE
jgi:hypothetical protein